MSFDGDKLKLKLFLSDGTEIDEDELLFQDCVKDVELLLGEEFVMISSTVKEPALPTMSPGSSASFQCSTSTPNDECSGIILIMIN